MDNNLSSKIGLEDVNGGVSSSRVNMYVWSIGVFVVWAFSAIMGVIHGVYVFPSIPETVVMLVLGSIGFKTIQRFGEKPATSEPPK